MSDALNQHSAAHRPSRGWAALAGLAVIGQAALTTAILLPKVSGATSPLAPVVAAPAVALPLIALPAVVRPAAITAPPAGRSDITALVAAQRARGLDCAVTSVRLPVCTHGGDDQLRSANYVTAASPSGGTPGGSGSSTRIGCYGDGRTGLRVQAVYARAEGSADRYDASLPALRTYAARTDAAFNAAAQSTGGTRHIRFVTTAGSSCQLVVARVVLPTAAFSSINRLVEALQQRGFQQSATTYLVWTESSVYCGIATMYVDDRPGLDNLNNGKLPGYARVDKPCWGKAEIHELVHTLGGVQPSAKNSTGSYHCNDGADVMCYDDGTARSTQRSVCAKTATPVLDCRHDDYFSTAAPRGSYLQTKWNVARSSFLAPGWTDPTPPPGSGSGATEPVAEQAPPPNPPASASPSPSPSASPSPGPSGPPPLLPPLPPLPSILPTSLTGLTTLLAGRS